MTDREMLRLAAKAARFGYTRSLWDPLADDGDALRLAVELRMDLFVRHEYCEAVAAMHVPVREPIQPTRTAAMRRAIVRAAAEIGRAMP